MAHSVVKGDSRPRACLLTLCVDCHAALKTFEELEADEEEEPTPDLEIQVPTSRVKLIIGPGGTKIQEIQKKSKCRVQVGEDL